MKPLILWLIFGCIVIPFSLHAQTTITLGANEKLTIYTDVEAETSMNGATIMTNNTSITYLVNFNEHSNNMYKLSASASKMKTSMNMGGTEMSYDSENPVDNQTVLGKEMNKQLKRIDVFELDRSTGNISPDTIVDKKNSINKELEKLLEDAFFVLPKGKKQGDSWTIRDTLSKDEITYSVKTISKDVFEIGFISKTERTKKMESDLFVGKMITQDLSFGHFVVDTASSRVKERITNTETFNVGEDVEVTKQSNSKMKTKIVYHY